jgi:hypothetical protein
LDDNDVGKLVKTWPGVLGLSAEQNLEPPILGAEKKWSSSMAFQNTKPALKQQLLTDKKNLLDG